MSIPITVTWSPAPPDCCVRSCQDVLDIVAAAMAATVNVTGIIISPNTPGVDDRGKLWIKVTVDELGYATSFVGLLVWNGATSTWINFTFDPATITAGSDCTVLGTHNGVVGHRTMSEVIDCIDEKQIPCAKVDFGKIPAGCTFQNWQIVIEANADSTMAGRIQFDVGWTSELCGAGRRFVTHSPVVAGGQYTLTICMPVDAANITISNLKGVAVGGWSNLLVDCTPPSCLQEVLVLPQVKRWGPFVVPIFKGAQVTQAHGFGGWPNNATAIIRYKGGGLSATYHDGDEIDLVMNCRTTDADQVYAIRWDDENITVMGLRYAGATTGTGSPLLPGPPPFEPLDWLFGGGGDPTDPRVPKFGGDYTEEGPFNTNDWDLYITAIYYPS